MDPNSPRPYRDYLLPRIPDSHKLTMTHHHDPLFAARKIILLGQDMNRFPNKGHQVILPLSPDDIKDLEEGHAIEKERTCTDCSRVDRWKFRLRTPGQEMEWTIVEGGPGTKPRKVI